VQLTWFFYGNLLPEESLKIAQTFELNVKRIFGAKSISTSQVELALQYELALLPLVFFFIAVFDNKFWLLR